LKKRNEKIISLLEIFSLNLKAIKLNYLPFYFTPFYLLLIMRLDNLYNKSARPNIKFEFNKQLLNLKESFKKWAYYSNYLRYGYPK